MLAADFIRKIWFPAGMLAVAVAFVLAFLVEDHPSDDVIALIVGGTIIGLPIAYGIYRATTGPRAARD